MERVTKFLGRVPLILLQERINGEAKQSKKPMDLERMAMPGLRMIVIAYFVVLLLPGAAIIRYAGLTSILSTLNHPDCLSTIRLSLRTSAISVFLTFILGTPTVFFLLGCKKKGFAKLLDIFIQLPVVLPPAAAGIGLILAFGRKGMAGWILAQNHLDVVFTPTAVVIAQVFVSSAYYVQILKTAVSGVPEEIFEASYVFGAGKVETIVKIILPMLKKAVFSGLTLAWIRALGEFGATIMFAGNILGKTRTIPLQIYTLMQTDMTMAAALTAVLFLVSLVLLIGLKLWLKEE